MLPDNQKRTQERIDAQRAIVAACVPGSEAHRIATEILLLLQDSLHIGCQIDALLAAARRIAAGR